MHEIRKLSPRGLWQLAPIRALIETLLVLIKSGHGGKYTPLYLRMLAQQSKSLHEKILENLNMRIKVWILQCPKRIHWVRTLIGEGAIRRWRRNRLADYALRKYFGDWQRKWPNGFKTDGFKAGGLKTDGLKQHTQNPAHKSCSEYTSRPYIWKPFALVKIVNVYGFLYGRTASNPAKASKSKWTQPREKRARKPIRFTPDELQAHAATGTPESGTLESGTLESGTLESGTDALKNMSNARTNKRLYADRSWPKITVKPKCIAGNIQLKRTTATDAREPPK